MPPITTIAISITEKMKSKASTVMNWVKNA